MAALFFDIDGTLLSEITKEIPKSAVEALHKAHEKGHQLFINTGRTSCSIPAMIKRLPFDGYLCGCGSHIIYKNEVLIDSMLSFGRGVQLIDCMEECRVEGLLEGNEDIYFSERTTRFEPVESTKRYMADMGLGVETSIEKKNFTFAKALVLSDEQSDLERFFSCLEPDMIALDRGNGMYECVQKAYSKGTCIEYMREKLEIPLDEVYVFGDSSNDLAMFEYAPHAVAMGTHDSVLDPYTEYVTDTVENDGIYKAFEHYGLL